MILTLAAFAQLAASCAPGADPGTLAAVARAESGFHAAALRDNTAGRSHFPASMAEAVATASALVHGQGHSVDLGLMQVNSANLPALGMSVAEALDPCRNIAAGARILAAAYRPGPGGDPQPALLRALSRYNTGSPTRGLANGYVGKVLSAAEQVVPALRPRAEGPAPPGPPAPPPWDVYGQARAAKAGRPFVQVPATRPAPPARGLPPAGAAGEPPASPAPVAGEAPPPVPPRPPQQG